MSSYVAVSEVENQSEVRTLEYLISTADAIITAEGFGVPPEVRDWVTEVYGAALDLDIKYEKEQTTFGGTEQDESHGRIVNSETDPDFFKVMARATARAEGSKCDGLEGDLLQVWSNALETAIRGQKPDVPHDPAAWQAISLMKDAHKLSTGDYKPWFKKQANPIVQDIPDEVWWSVCLRRKQLRRGPLPLVAFVCGALSYKGHLSKARKGDAHFAGVYAHAQRAFATDALNLLLRPTTTNTHYQKSSYMSSENPYIPVVRWDSDVESLRLLIHTAKIVITHNKFGVPPEVQDWVTELSEAADTLATKYSGKRPTFGLGSLSDVKQDNGGAWEDTDINLITDPDFYILSRRGTDPVSFPDDPDIRYEGLIDPWDTKIHDTFTQDTRSAKEFALASHNTVEAYYLMATALDLSRGHMYANWQTLYLAKKLERCKEILEEYGSVTAIDGGRETGTPAFKP